jgi:hypothetical protein
MRAKHRVKWTVPSQDVREHYVNPLLNSRSLKIGHIARLFRVGKDKMDRISRGTVNRTHAVRGGAPIRFDKTFDRTLPHFEIIRGAYLIIDQLRNMRADVVRPDYIVNTIETGKSFLALHRSSASGPAAAVLDSLAAVLKFSGVLCGWRPKNAAQPLSEMRDAKGLVMKAIEGYRAFTREEDRHVASFFLPTDYQNLFFLAAELDERTTGIDFDEDSNPHTETLAVLQQLEEWGAVKELQDYAQANGSLRAAWNLATVFGLRAHNPVIARAGDSEATEEALLLALRIQKPGPGEDLHVPEMGKGPRDISYLREAYERTLKRYRDEIKAKEEGDAKEENVSNVIHAIYAILAPVTGAGIALLLLVAELLAKPVPG